MPLTGWQGCSKPGPKCLQSKHLAPLKSSMILSMDYSQVLLSPAKTRNKCNIFFLFACCFSFLFFPQPSACPQVIPASLCPRLKCLETFMGGSCHHMHPGAWAFRQTPQTMN